MTASRLRKTVMIAAFEGWNDAGSAASDALAHLTSIWDAKQVGHLDPEDYHDFQVTRPLVHITPEGRRTITWPATTIWMADLPDRRVLLVHGIEPSFRWKRYCDELLAIAREFSVHTLITMGSLLADVPHTRPIPVSVSSESSAVSALESDTDLGSLSPSNYEGPTGIVGILQHFAAEDGLTGISLWAAVPHYVANPPSPKATWALLTKVEELLGHSIDMGDLAEDTEAWMHCVGELASEDPDIAEYIEQLERAQDTTDLPEASGDAIAKEFEQWLKRRGDSPGDNPGKGD